MKAISLFLPFALCLSSGASAADGSIVLSCSGTVENNQEVQVLLVEKDGLPRGARHELIVSTVGSHSTIVFQSVAFPKQTETQLIVHQDKDVVTRLVGQTVFTKADGTFTGILLVKDYTGSVACQLAR